MACEYGPIGFGPRSVVTTFFTGCSPLPYPASKMRSEEHTSELQSLRHLVCRLLLEKKKKKKRASSSDAVSACVAAQEVGVELRPGRASMLITLRQVLDDPATTSCILLCGWLAMCLC